MEGYTVHTIERKDAIPWIKLKHYARRIPSITNSYGLIHNSTVVGVCTYGMPPAKMDVGEPLRELTRLILDESEDRKNLLSWFVSSTLHLLPKPLIVVSFADPNQGHYGYIYQATNWVYTGTSQKGGKDGVWFMNGRGYHSRTITEKLIRQWYRGYDSNKGMRDNWKAAGGTISEPLTKHRYFITVGNKRDRKRLTLRLSCLYEFLPYPKGESKRYDTSAEFSKQVQMFD